VTPALTDATLTRVFIAAVFAAADLLFTPPTAAPAPTYETAKAGAWPSHRALLVTSYAHRRRTLTKPEHQTSGFSATCYG
jgi:hypothetical protein